MQEDNSKEAQSQPLRRLRKVSSSSTLCQTPPPTDLISIIHSEERRYIRKGYGLISATLIALSFFYFGPIISRNSWPWVLQKIEENQWEPWKFVIVCTTLWHAFWVCFANLCMWAIYHVELPFFERYKINPNPWPWYENKEEYKKLAKKSIMLCALNGLVSLPILLTMAMASTNFEVQYSLKIEDIPDWKTLMLNITFCMICEDMSFHFVHRFLHWKVIYPYIHKVHHTYVTTIGIAAEYSHPIEFIFGAALPGAVGSMILGKNMHYCTVLLWTIVRVCETLDGHCGYEFSWSPYRLIPFSSSASYHDFHHSHNVGNYSSFFSFWDTIFGQNKAFYQYQERIKEAQNRHDEAQKHFNSALQTKLLEAGEKID